MVRRRQERKTYEKFVIGITMIIVTRTLRMTQT